MDGHDLGSPKDAKQPIPPEARDVAMSHKRCVSLYKHAFKCSERRCALPACQSVKQLLLHMERCLMTGHESNCIVCTEVMRVSCPQAKSCAVAKHILQSRRAIKRKIRVQQQWARFQHPPPGRDEATAA